MRTIHNERTGAFSGGAGVGELQAASTGLFAERYNSIL